MKKPIATKKGIKELREANEKVVRWVHENKIPIIVLTGRTSQSAAIMFKEKWKQLYPNYKKDPLPKFYALGVTSADGRIWIDILAHIKRVIKNMPGLEKNLDKPILFYSDYIESGSKLNQIRKAFEQIGAKKILTGALFSVVEQPPAFSEKIDIIGKIHNYDPFFVSLRSPVSEYVRNKKILKNKRQRILAMQRQLRRILRRIV